jgi:hypothetical protein
MSKTSLQAKLQIHDQNTPPMRPQMAFTLTGVYLSLGKIDFLV